jgi:type I restriction enzyme S subunit
MRPDTSKIIPKFLFYFLDIFHSNGGTIPMQTATTNIRNIKTPQYMDIEVPLPTLETQVKVMELLEEYVSRLDSSVELADEMEKQAAGLRRSLLQAAFTGQLTNEVTNV